MRVDWTQQELPDAARIGVATVRLFESEGTETRQATLVVLRQAFEPPVSSLPIVISPASKVTKQPKPRRQVRGSRQPGHWLLQDAKACFSELVRCVRSEGPQHVTVHGRDEVVVIAAEEFRRLKGDLTGQALIAAMQASPHRDIDIEPKGVRMPVRDVAL